MDESKSANHSRTAPVPSGQLPLYAGLVLAASFLVLHWPYGYVIAAQSETNDCFFMFGRSFLGQFFDHPAGPLRYAGRFLGQFYHFQWLGALIASACITCFGVLFHRVLAKLNGTTTVFPMLLPCVLLLALHTSTLWLVHDTLGLCASCGAFLGYLSLRAKAARHVYALAATPVVYVLLGVYFWLFVAWVIVFEWLDGPLRSGLAFKIVYVVFSVAVPLIAWRWVFPIPLRSALMCPILFDPPFRTVSGVMTFGHLAADCALAVVLCGLLLLIPLWGRLFSGRRFGAFRRARSDRWRRACLTGLVFVLAILLHWVRYDAPLAAVVACRQLYKERQWDALLEKAKANPFGDLRVQFMINFALYHKGRLLEEMFRYPQPWGTRGLFLNFSGVPVVSSAEDDTEDGMYNSDLLYEMGHVNYAFRHAYNSMCLQGRTYDTLKRIAQCSMVNGEYAMATKYLNLLERTLFHRGFARRYKAILADPVAAEKEFGELRKRLPVAGSLGHPVAHSYPAADFHPVTQFVTLLNAKRDNRMAFDYLMAWLLLDKGQDSINSVCGGVRRLRTAGYTSIPTHCQEAMLLKERMDRTAVDLQGFRYDEATVARVEQFFEDMSGHGDRPATPELARTLYGDTYMFYYYFTATPNEARRVGEAPGGFGGASPQE